MDKNKTIAVWGTLRKDRGNHRWALADDKSNFVGIDYLEGIMNNGLSLYNSDDESLEVEVYEVDEKNFKIIDEFERGFSYIPKEVILKSGIQAIVWFDISYLRRKGEKVFNVKEQVC